MLQERKSWSGDLIDSQVSLTRALSTFRTGSVTVFAALDSILLHLVHPVATGTNTRAFSHHVVIYTQPEANRAH